LRIDKQWNFSAWAFQIRAGRRAYAFKMVNTGLNAFTHNAAGLHPL